MFNQKKSQSPLDEARSVLKGLGDNDITASKELYADALKAVVKLVLSDPFAAPESFIFEVKYFDEWDDFDKSHCGLSWLNYFSNLRSLKKLRDLEDFKEHLRVSGIRVPVDVCHALDAQLGDWRSRVTDAVRAQEKATERVQKEFRKNNKKQKGRSAFSDIFYVCSKMKMVVPDSFAQVYKMHNIIADHIKWAQELAGIIRRELANYNAQEKEKGRDVSDSERYLILYEAFNLALDERLLMRANRRARGFERVIDLFMAVANNDCSVLGKKVIQPQDAYDSYLNDFSWKAPLQRDMTRAFITAFGQEEYIRLRNSYEQHNGHFIQELKRKAQSGQLSPYPPAK